VENAITVSNLTKKYATKKFELLALNNVSFDVGEQEFVSIVGPSGCGKSTLLRILSGLEKKTQGSILFRGNEVQSLEDFGVVFQFPVLLPWRHVLDNILTPVDLLKLNKKSHRETALDLARLTGISEFVKSYPWELSGGMQQRVSICRALVTNPSILLMDEPFGSLDAFTRDLMALELLRIWQERKKTVIFVTHSISEAVLLSDKVLVMTPRPGSLAAVVPIPLRRPRNLEVRESPEFVKCAGTITKMIFSYFDGWKTSTNESLTKEKVPSQLDVTNVGL
jgi:NitT/TauT family transport system ATP-binding protein